MIKKLLKAIPLIAAILIFLGVIFFKVIPSIYKGRTQIISSTSLISVLKDSRLSTSQFTYNGIAQVYNENGDVVCNILYKANVKAGINDISKIDLVVNNEKKEITVNIPQITITSDIVDDSSLSFIPEKTNVEMKEAFLACKADAYEEVSQSTALYETAEKGLKSIIEGLLIPVVEKQGYSIVWESNE